MSTESPARLMNVEALLALPEDDAVVRELIEGEQRESPMTRRSRKHSRTTMTIGFLLSTWAEETGIQGEVHGGEVGATLCHHPDIAVGIDVAWGAAEIASVESDTTLIDGPTTLAAEVLSLSDTHQLVSKKVDMYLKCGVPLVWGVDSHFQTVTVYRSDQLPEQFTTEQDLDGSPALPDFSCPVAAIQQQAF
jgi:Uma2 family endonuclease